MVRLSAWEAVAVDHDWLNGWVSLRIRKEKCVSTDNMETHKAGASHYHLLPLRQMVDFWLRPVKGISLVVNDTSLGAD